MTLGIPDQDLRKYKCVVMYDDERVGDAIAMLRDQKGMDWWYLVVELEQGGYAVTSFGGLEKPFEENGEAFLTTPLSALVGSLLKTAEVAEQGTLSLADAQALARDSDGQAVVIVQNGECLGVIPNMTRGTRSGGLFESQLVTMMGEYAPIPQAGVLSRRRLMKNK